MGLSWLDLPLLLNGNLIEYRRGGDVVWLNKHEHVTAELGSGNLSSLAALVEEIQKARERHY
jgi:hypothetical protein